MRYIPPPKKRIGAPDARIGGFLDIGKCLYLSCSARLWIYATSIVLFALSFALASGGGSLIIVLVNPRFLAGDAGVICRLCIANGVCPQMRGGRFCLATLGQPKSACATLDMTSRILEAVCGYHRFGGGRCRLCIANGVLPAKRGAGFAGNARRKRTTNWQ